LSYKIKIKESEIMFLSSVENANQIASLIYTIVSLAILIIPSIVSAVIFIIKAVKNKDWRQIMNVADAAMKEVEEYAKAHPNMTSDEKLDMALNAVQKSLSSMNITFDDATKEKTKNYINQTIKWFNDMKK